MADEIVAKTRFEDITQTQGNVLGLVASDKKATEYLLFGETTDATPTELSLDSLGADFLETQDGKSYFVEAVIMGRLVGGQDSSYAKWSALLTRGTGVASGLTAWSGYNNYEDAGLTGIVTLVSIDTATDGKISINVTGLAATNIKWVASVKVTEL